MGNVSVDPNKTLSGASWYVLDRSAVPVATPADVTEDTLATINVPALQPNSVLRITVWFTSNNNVNAKTPRIRFSGAAGTVVWSGTLASVGSPSGAQVLIVNRNATNSQVVEWVAMHQGGSATNSSGALVTTAVDTTGASSIVITGQKATAGDTLQLEGYLVEMLT